MTDLATLERRRHGLVERLRITDPAVRAAMRRVPREEFLPMERADEAYLDEPIPLGPGAATISAPHMVVLLAEALDVRPGDRILDIGAGMGYLSAVLAELVGAGGHVDAVEIDRFLADEAQRRLRRQGYSAIVSVRAADGMDPQVGAAPYDGIVVSFAVPELYQVWTSQLVDGGRLVAPVGDSVEQRLVTYTRRGSGGSTVEGPRCRFVPQQRRRTAPI